MKSGCELLELQWAQLRHDERYHKDVMALTLPQRIKHMVLHYAKYTGYLLDAAEREDKSRTVKVLTDAFIISLATANALNQDLSKDMADPEKALGSVKEVGERLSAESRVAPPDQTSIVRKFVRQTGILAKACESLDHLESFPFRGTMCVCNVELLKAILIEANSCEISLSELYRDRILEVESRSMFDTYLKNSTRGEA